jgi:hypothetical protein
MKLFKKKPKAKIKPISRHDFQAEERERKRHEEHQRAIDFINRVCELRGEG